MGRRGILLEWEESKLPSSYRTFAYRVKLLGWGDLEKVW